MKVFIVLFLGFFLGGLVAVITQSPGIGALVFFVSLAVAFILVFINIFKGVKNGQK